MRLVTIGLVLLSVGLTSGAQIALKAGMTAPDVRGIMEGGRPLRIAIGLSSSPLIIFGLLSYGLSAIVWLLVLSRVPLSTAYPFIALGIAITTLGGRFLFHEPLTATKLAGIGLVLIGILAIGFEGAGEATMRIGS